MSLVSLLSESEPGVEAPGEGVPAVAEVAHLAHPPVSVLLRHRALLAGRHRQGGRLNTHTQYIKEYFNYICYHLHPAPAPGPQLVALLAADEGVHAAHAQRDVRQVALTQQLTRNGLLR